MELKSHPHLYVKVDSTKRLRLEFHDNHIFFTENRKSGLLEVWYKPASSSAYRITVVKNVQQAIHNMRELLQYEKRKAVDILYEIDTHNEKVLTDKEADAMHEIKHDLMNIVNGKKYFSFLNPNKKKYAVA